MGKSGSGGGGGKLLLLGALGLAVVAGGWNYARNTAAEQATFRPYKSYAQDDLEDMLRAYEAEIEVLQQRYSAASNSRATAEERATLNDRVREFERVQHYGRATRDLGAQLLETQAATKLLHLEIERRKTATGDWDLYLERIFVYRS